MSIARARIHVERAIQRIKLYGILNFIPYQYRSLASTILTLPGWCMCNPGTEISLDCDQWQRRGGGGGEGAARGMQSVLLLEISLVAKLRRKLGQLRTRSVLSL